MERGKLQVDGRPLTQAEARLLHWGALRELRLLMGALPWVMTLTGGVIFGGLWILTLLATKADKSGPSWRLSGLIWLVLGLFISAWSYRDVSKYIRTRDSRFQSALRRNLAAEVRIQSLAVVEITGEDGKITCYSFQLPDGRVAFVDGRTCASSLRFPNSDFSVVAIPAENGRLTLVLIEKRGKKLTALRRIPAEKGWKMAAHPYAVEGDLGQLEDLLRRSG